MPWDKRRVRGGRGEVIKASVAIGDVFDNRADVLICPANPWLNLSGGVNGEILLRCGPSIQQELHENLRVLNRKSLPAGSVVASSAKGLNFNKIVHAIAIDPFYDTDKTLVASVLNKAWIEAAKHGTTAVMPMLATGYGRLPIDDFVEAFRTALKATSGVDLSVLLVLRNKDQLSAFRDCNLSILSTKET